jgi:hypothetical protein
MEMLDSNDPKEAELKRMLNEVIPDQIIRADRQERSIKYYLDNIIEPAKDLRV